MHTIERHRFGPVEGFRLGFGPLWAPPLTVFMYWLDGLLVDTGQSHMRRHAARLLEGRRVRQIALTHHHEDHSGNAGPLAASHGATVLGHPLAARKLERGFAILPYQHATWGLAAPVEVAPLPAMLHTDAFRLEPIHTPGHSKDHTVYLEPDHGWLFAGDLFLGERIKFFRSDEDIGQQIASIRLVLRRDFEALFCSHRPAPRGGHARLARKLQFLEDFAGEVARLARRGLGEREILRALARQPQDRLVRLFTTGNASFAHMVRSALRAATMRATA